MNQLFDELNDLNSNMGIYGVVGNHDYNDLSSDQIKNKISDHFTLLDDNTLKLNYKDSSFYLSGIGDLWYEEPHLNLNQDEKLYHIVISHNPDYAESISKSEIDLVLSGHTHGGQITFFGLFAPFIPSDYGQKYRTGFIRNENINVIVSNGLGSTALPMRFFAPPQIVVIKFI